MYVDALSGSTFLNTGDVWKYGTTVNAVGGYTKTQLDNWNIDITPQYYGSVAGILFQGNYNW